MAHILSSFHLYQFKIYATMNVLWGCLVSTGLLRNRWQVGDAR